MKAAPFDYLRVDSVADACAALADPAVDSRPIAGGQTLVPMMAMRIVRPQRLVDLNPIAALGHAEVTDTHVRTGALLRQAHVEHTPALSSRLPLLAAALTHVGHPATRVRGTLGGSLAAADPAAEIGLVAATLGASVHLCGTQRSRALPAAEFLLGALETALEDDEIVTAVDWPQWPAANGAIGTGFEEVAVRHGDFALVAAAVQLQLDPSGRCVRAALGIANVGPQVLVPDTAPLVGTGLDDATIAEFARAQAPHMAPPADYQADARYRRRVAVTLLERALLSARDSALDIAANGGTAHAARGRR